MPPEIHPTALIEKGAKLAEGVKVGPYSIVGAQVALAQGVELVSHVVVAGRTSIGEKTRIHPFASLGGPPQHLRYAGEDVTLEIGARNVIREHVTINLGTPFGRGQTVLGDDCFLMAGAHIAHDCIVGNHVVFTNNAMIAGHVEVGDHVNLGGASAVHQHVRIGAHAMVGGLSGLENDLIPYAICLGDRAELAGLNIVGLKRRGFSRQAIHTLRRAYRDLFGEGGTLERRIVAAEAEYADSPEVMAIVQFLKSEGNRGVCLPRAGHRISDP